MTYQEVLWENKIVMVVSAMSRSRKVHSYVKKYIGRVGRVQGESKSNMLLIDFGNKQARTRAIPAGCVVDVSTVQRAGYKQNESGTWVKVR